ncbi:MAG TPA: RpiB/LacA/LacB family sugar-phosphate isomerase [Gemmatimonadales bacterium]|jgi:hypothetical protein
MRTAPLTKPAAFLYPSPWLRRSGGTVTPSGLHSADPADYPDFAHPVAAQVERGLVRRGILLFGTGLRLTPTSYRQSESVQNIEP